MTTLGGGFFASFLVGYFIKKIIKILMFVFGGILALLIYLLSQGIIIVDDVNKIQNSGEATINPIIAQLALTFPTDNNLFVAGNNLGIPLTGSIASGFMLGSYKEGLDRIEGKKCSTVNIITFQSSSNVCIMKKEG
jgi:uncharacterized membrane protein (Fun14 family)